MEINMPEVEKVSKGRKVPLAKMVEQAKRINAKLAPLEARKEQIEEMITELREKVNAITDQTNELYQIRAGLNGHISMMELGATHYRTGKTDRGWDYIEFFNEAGEQVRRKVD
jgi:uncharacterized coiled-coil DUF342 family protein